MIEVTEKLLKPLVETKYLTVENADRYRSIIRLFYLQYERLKYWMYQEDVYEMLIQNEYFTSYTLEQCQQDLAALTNWKNLVAIQDTRKVSTVDEFRNKKYRYQLSEYSVEIERMVIRLENLHIEGGSLEPVLLERIRNHLEKIDMISEQTKDVIYSWWNDLNNDFIRLNQNYQDYMRELNSVKAEELMKTKEFLLFKDRLMEYLRTFVQSLQINVVPIEHMLKQIDSAKLDNIFTKVTEYELSIPRIDVDRDEIQIREQMEGKFASVREWFLGKNGKESEALQIFDTTNEIIRKITRYATRISEASHSGANRKQEYYKVATLFSKCTSIKEAHQLSAAVFGIETPFHLKGNFIRYTDSVHSGVFEEEPLVIEVVPRIRQYREKAKRTGIIDRTQEKENLRKKTLEKLEIERRLYDSYIQNNQLDFSKLHNIEPYVRDVFLTWLSKALENSLFQGKTEDGRTYYIENREEKKMCRIECTDGVFTMPAYRLNFKE